MDMNGIIFITMIVIAGILGIGALVLKLRKIINIKRRSN